MKKLTDECFDAPETVNEDGNKVQWYEGSRHGVYCILDGEELEKGLMGVAAGRVRMRPAMGSGAVDHIVHHRELPDDAASVPNTSGRHSHGASASILEKFGVVRRDLQGH